MIELTFSSNQSANTFVNYSTDADMRDMISAKSKSAEQPPVPEAKPAEVTPARRPSSAQLSEPGVIESPSKMKEVLRDRETAELVEKDYLDQLMNAEEAISSQGGRSQAPSALILARQDAITAIKTIREVKESLPPRSTETAIPASPEAKPAKSKTDTAFESRVYERMKEEHPDMLEGDLLVETKRLKEDLSRSMELLEKDPEKAYRIAEGVETSPDILSTSMNIVMAEKALRDGNHALYADLTRSRSLAQTRRGQEIVAERGSVSDNSTSRYVKLLLASRLDALGKLHLGEVVNNVKAGIRRQPLTSTKSKAMQKLDAETAKAEKKLKDRDMGMEEAQALIDKLACK